MQLIKINETSKEPVCCACVGFYQTEGFRECVVEKQKMATSTTPESVDLPKNDVEFLKILKEFLKEEDWARALSSEIEVVLPNNETLQKMINCIKPSYQIERCVSQATILVVGASGDGKSSTINHFFDQEVFPTSSETSCTKATEERYVVSSSDKLKINNLKLAVVDSPGFHDVISSRMAGNINSIRNFFKNYPSGEKKFPNVILFVCSIMDTRMDGPDSKLAKSLRELAKLELVDRLHPNLVIVFTFSCSVAKKRFEQRKKEVKNISQKLAALYIGLRPRVVFIENEFEDHDLKKTGSWTVLPDNTRQVYNLFRAMMEVLAENNDSLGFQIISHFFEKMPEDVRIGKKVDVSFDDAENPTLETQETEIDKIIRNHATQHPEDANDAITLGLALAQKNFKLPEDIRGKTIGSVATALSPFPLNQNMEKILKKLFKLRKMIIPRRNIAVGRCYNVFRDELSTKSICIFNDEQDTVPGFQIPKGVDIEVKNETRETSYVYNDITEYRVKRLAKLNVHCDLTKFIAEVKPGVNISNNSTGTESGNQSTYSFLYERFCYAFRLNSANYVLNRQFLTAVKLLPEKFNESDDDSLYKFQSFLRSWGHYVLIRVYCGGAMMGKINTTTNLKSVQDQVMKIKTELNLKLKMFEKLPSLGLDAEFRNDGNENAHTYIENALVSLQGGDIPSNLLSLGDWTPEAWSKWSNSLAEKSSILESDMELQAMHLVIKDLATRDDVEITPNEANEKAKAIFRAQCHILGQSFSDSYQIPNSRIEAVKEWIAYCVMAAGCAVAKVLFAVLKSIK
ncbi:uncharacterized protein LOC130649094 [Hydractinia symbiolongicarpus]|uniref:uncharacterized protein LOC130649094 n=1 Tax=Hydractinia symbiolongicarpus TaxID=13093 RepID=UPI00254BCF51|nr:uncharacterized protein LOC130649094 [Hydractinia symbiolongicarpus]